MSERRCRSNSDRIDELSDAEEAVPAGVVFVGSVLGRRRQYSSIYGILQRELGVELTEEHNTYRMLEDLLRLVLPILRMWISCSPFFVLFLCTTPCELDICKFVVWVKSCRPSL